VYAPVGLRIGAVSPEEIAVSIVGELVALRHGERTGSHMRALEDPAIRRALDEGETLDGDSSIE
jgi:xanthine dehydrogenase accessory factor